MRMGLFSNLVLVANVVGTVANASRITDLEKDGKETKKRVSSLESGLRTVACRLSYVDRRSEDNARAIGPMQVSTAETETRRERMLARAERRRRSRD
jgi:intracellular sulfur oxidation DsrE/DsrF family protein